MESIDKYFTVAGHNLTEIKINRSRFIAQVFPVTEKQEITLILEKIRKEYFDASHHPYAYRLGLSRNNFKSSDDGEPSGSSGKPVLDAIDKYNLTDVILVVTRYFGGVKLGVGGLKRAFFDSAEECLKNAEIIEKFIFSRIIVEFEYRFIGAVMNLIEKEKIDIKNNFSAEKVVLECEVRLSLIENFKSQLTNLTNGQVLITEL